MAGASSSGLGLGGSSSLRQSRYGELAAMARGLCHSATWRRSCWSCAGLLPTSGIEPGQGGQPSVMGGVELRLRPVFGIRSGACQVVNLCCYELSEDRLGRGGRRFGGPDVGERPGRSRHQSGQLGHPVGILADKHRNPCRHGIPAPFREAGQELLTGRQRDRQLHGVGPVGQIGSDGDAGFHDLLPVPLLQQLHGLLRCQAGALPRSMA